MLEYNFEGKNIFNPLENRMQEVIDTFVSFYGEEYRERVTDKLTKNKTYFLGQEESNSIENSINRLFKERVDDLSQKFTNSINFELTGYYKPSDVTFALMNLDNSMYEKNNYPLHVLMTELGFVKPRCSNKEINLIKNDEELFQGILNIIFSLKQKWESKFQNEYDNLIKQKDALLIDMSPFCQRSDNFDYFGKFKSIIDKYAIKHGFNINDDIKLDDNTLLAIENYLVLYKHPLAKTIVTESLKNNFKNYFNYLGLNNKYDTFEQYSQDEQLEAFLKDETLEKDILNLKIEQRKSQFKNNIFYKDYIELLKQEGEISNINKLALNAIHYIFDNFSVAYVQSIVKEDDCYSISILPQALALNDHVLFHELIHVIESDFNRSDDNELSYKVGFSSTLYKENYQELDEDAILKLRDEENEDLHDEETDENKQVEYSKISFLNEVVTDYISGKVYENWKKSSHSPIGFLLNKEDSTYSVAFPLLSKFFDENLDTIIKCRMSQDADAFRKMIGEEYYRKLYNATFAYGEIVCKYPLILRDISKKTNLDLDNLHDCFKYDCEWTNDEQKIVDAYSSINEISKVIELRKEFDSNQKPKKNKKKNNNLDREI